MGNAFSASKQRTVIVKQYYHDSNGRVIYQTQVKSKVSNHENYRNNEQFRHPYLQNQTTDQSTNNFPEHRGYPQNNISFPDEITNQHNSSPQNHTIPQAMTAQTYKMKQEQKLNFPHNKMNHLPQNEYAKAREGQLINIVQQLRRKIQEAQQFGKKMKDPKKFKQFEAQALQNYVQKLKEMKFPENIDNQLGKCIKFIIGRISSGKSSLINSFFNTKLAVGTGETTLEASLVFQENNVEIYDTPGQCEEFNTMNLDNVKHIAASSQVYILFCDSLKTIQRMVKVVAAIKPHRTIILRTQCDRANKNSHKTIEQEIEEDYNILRNWGIEGIKIYATSSHIKEGFDNNRVKQMMKSNCYNVIKTQSSK